MINQLGSGLFINTDIPLYMWIISQVFGLFVIVSVFMTFQMKKKTWILWGMAIANTMSVFMHAFLGNWAVAAISAVTALKSVSFIWTTKKEGKIPAWFSFSIFVFFSLFAAGAVAFTHFGPMDNPNANWYDWVILGAQIIANFTQWRLGPHWIRASSALFSILAIVNNIMFLNVMGLINSGIKLTSIALIYIRLGREKKLITNQTHPPA